MQYVYVVEYGSCYGDGPRLVGIYRHREDAERKAARLGEWATVIKKVILEGDEEDDDSEKNTSES